MNVVTGGTLSKKYSVSVLPLIKRYIALSILKF
jgi:hypothetical protein